MAATSRTSQSLAGSARDIRGKPRFPKKGAGLADSPSGIALIAHRQSHDLTAIKRNAPKHDRIGYIAEDGEASSTPGGMPTSDESAATRR
ncbi:hypothetical protein [Novosphingobium album (ex Liu et al. 2023)]|uniref:Uncharacterized protein n=1 Tax=Novosphingobium album (ex Liu et al. 2023) TaxID=3031130 RepID=A0ABT5WJH7_9SPHN|nr:hypothetical protein [Novosphingobium album (ex Liu et al. 2023)]MDE8650193.1 hypothetical protein [Novosphingobium album (ex Liu et al. 2023)]